LGKRRRTALAESCPKRRICALPNGLNQQADVRSEGAGLPSISKNDRWVAYELNRGENTHLAIMDANGGQSQTLIDEPGHVWARNWSPDNRRIVYAGFRDAAWNIWWIDRSPENAGS